MDELKKCQACGGEATSYGGAISCDNPNCGMMLIYMPRELWQRRPLEDALTAEVAALREALAKSHSALNCALNPRTPSDIMLAVKYLEGIEAPPEAE